MYSAARQQEGRLAHLAIAGPLQYKLVKHFRARVNVKKSSEPLMDSELLQLGTKFAGIFSKEHLIDFPFNQEDDLKTMQERLMFFSQRGKVFKYDLLKRELTLQPVGNQMQLLDFFQ